ncbi:MULTISPECIES: hypothetical protein [unclassified Saccharothrix]|uniref:hypothetical protein n=1 Tax=unclassified Saccharothrix TaxID=2593673 RepID=UPI00307D0532
MAPPIQSAAETDAVKSAAQWAAGGFTALTAILTFFGIKDGYLTELLQGEPTVSILIFCLVGLGLLCGLVAPLAVVRGGVPLKFVLLGVGALTVLLGVPLTDIDEVEHRGLVTVLVVAVATAWLATLAWTDRDGIEVTAVTALILTGVAATSLGLYGAAKLALIARTDDVPVQVTASVEESALKLVVKAAIAPGEPKAVVVRAMGLRDETEIDIGQALVSPDGTGEVDGTVTFPLGDAKWSGFVVRHCQEWDCTASSVVLRIGGNPLPDGRGGAGAVQQGDNGVLQASATVWGVPKGAVVEVAVRRSDADGLQVTVAPRGDGVATWSGGFAGGPAGSTTAVSYRICEGEGDCAIEWEQVAVYRTPAESGDCPGG